MKNLKLAGTTHEVPWLPICSLLIALVMNCGVRAQTQSWPEFRGPGGTGLALAGRLPTEWSDSTVKWRTELPGRGWSSPVIADQQIWLTSALETRAAAEVAAARLRTATMPNLEVRSRVRLLALCVDLKTGKLLHQIELFAIEDPPLLHSLNSFASPTPCLDGDAVYCHFGTMGTAAIDRQTGRVLWKNTELQLEHETGPGSSPIVAGDLLVVNCDGIDQQFVVAFRKSDGAIAWRQSRSGELHPEGMMKKAFSTPVLWDSPAGSQLISAGANWIYGYEPESGRELWKIPYGQLGFSNVPRPQLGPDLLYVSTGFTEPTLLAIRLDPSGRLNASHIAWEFRSQVPTMPTPIRVDSRLYMVSDRGVATCLDAASGQQIWQKRFNGEFAASPILADNKLFFANRDGLVYVIAPSDSFQLLATNRLEGAVMATPAAVDDRILIRTETAIYSIGDP